MNTSQPGSVCIFNNSMNYPQLLCTDLLNTEAERLKVTQKTGNGFLSSVLEPLY